MHKSFIKKENFFCERSNQSLAGTVFICFINIVICMFYAI